MEKDERLIEICNEIVETKDVGGDILGLIDMLRDHVGRNYGLKLDCKNCGRENGYTLKYGCDGCGWWDDDEATFGAAPRIRLEYLREEIHAGRISQFELLELQGLVPYIDNGDVELLEWAGVPEFPEELPDPTYGPWKLDPAEEQPLAVIVDDERGEVICEIGRPGTRRCDSTPEQVANAYLISASIDMLKAAERLYPYLAGIFQDDNTYLEREDLRKCQLWIDDLDCAIKKARGKSA